jgi:hypothetical protein
MYSTVVMYPRIVWMDLERGVLQFSSKSNPARLGGCDGLVFRCSVIRIACRWDDRLICSVGGHLTGGVVVVALIMTVRGQMMVRSFRRSGWRLVRCMSRV